MPDDKLNKDLNDSNLPNMLMKSFYILSFNYILTYRIIHYLFTTF